MNILLIIMVCITPFVHSADCEHPFVPYGTYGLRSVKHLLPDGAWGSPTCPVQQYTFDKSQELTEEAVMNPFWQRMKEKSQEKKISILISIGDHLRGDHNYPALRYNIAAALYADIDLIKLQALPEKESCDELLSNAVIKEDYYLTLLLLKHKANVHERFSTDPVIYLAKTAALAALLINAGALQKNTRSGDGKTLLHRAMWADHEPALIQLYKEHGIDPMISDNNSWTPLMELTTWADRHTSYNLVINKISLLLEGLPKEKAIALVKAKHHGGNTIFNIIENKKRNSDKTEKHTLDALHKYLLDTLKSLESA